MRSMLFREVAAIRATPLLVAVWAHASLLALFLFIWDNGVPVLPGEHLYDQQRVFQWVVLGALLPWTATRCLTPERGDDIALLSALLAVRPSRVVSARLGATFCALAAVVLGGFPIVILAQQMSALPLGDALRGLIPLFAFAALSAVIAVACTVTGLDRITAWIATMAVTACGAIAIVKLVPGGFSGGIAFAVIGSVVLALRADASLRYLSESSA